MHINRKFRVLFLFTIFGLAVPVIFIYLGDEAFTFSEAVYNFLNVLGWFTWPSWFLTYLALSPANGEPVPYVDLIVIGGNGFFWFMVGAAYTFTMFSTKIWRLGFTILIYALLQGAVYLWLFLFSNL